MSGTVIMNLSFQVRMREGRVDRKTGSGAVYRVFDQIQWYNEWPLSGNTGTRHTRLCSISHSPATAYSTFGCLVFDYTQAGSVIWSRILLCPPYNGLNSRPKVDFVTPIIF